MKLGTQIGRNINPSQRRGLDLAITVEEVRIVRLGTPAWVHANLKVCIKAHCHTSQYRGIFLDINVKIYETKFCETDSTNLLYDI